MATRTSFPEHASPGPDEGSRRWALVWAVLRLAMVAAIAAATIDQIRLAVAAGAVTGIAAPTATLRLLSFFTVQSNALAAAVLAWAAVRALAGNRRVDSPALGFSLAAVTTYMLVTGLVYNIVLRSAGDVGIMLGWSNNVHHVIAPAFLLLDLLVGAGRRALRWRALGGILIYPLAWVAATLLLGPRIVSPSTGATPWYPYPFLDPASTTGGSAGVAVWVAGIAAVIAALGALTVLVGRLRDRGHRDGGRSVS